MFDLPLTILLALLTGAIGYLGALSTRGNLVSGFRQNWINDQRSDLATIAAKATIMSGNLSADWARDMEALAAALSRVRLRENPDKPEWSPVIDKLVSLQRQLWDNRNREHDVTNLLKDIDELSRIPLKQNWTKTQEGEDTYRSGLRLAGWVLASVIAALVTAFMISLILGSNSKTEKDPIVTQNCFIKPHVQRSDAAAAAMPISSTAAVLPAQPPSPTPTKPQAGKER